MNIGKTNKILLRISKKITTGFKKKRRNFNKKSNGFGNRMVKLENESVLARMIEIGAHRNIVKKIRIQETNNMHLDFLERNRNDNFDN